MALDPRTPVLVGVGQWSNRVDRGEAAVEPVDMMAEALRRAAGDSGARGDVLAGADAIRAAKETIRTCSVCNNLTDVDPCHYCTGAGRNRRTICVVEEATNILPVEKTRQYNGLYHVLGGALSPLQGIGPEQLHIKGLIERLKEGGVEEIIIATNPTAEGEATAAYLAQLLKPLTPRVSRIGMGVPVGGELDYADEVTVSQALRSRRTL